MKFEIDDYKDLDSMVWPSPLLAECRNLEDGDEIEGFFTTKVGVLKARVKRRNNRVIIDGDTFQSRINGYVHMDCLNGIVWVTQSGGFWHEGATQDLQFAIKVSVANAVDQTIGVLEHWPDQYVLPSRDEIYREVKSLLSKVDVT